MASSAATPRRSSRPASGPWRSRDDTRRIQDLVRDRLERDWPALRFHPGDLDWWVVSAYGRVPGVEGRVRLWPLDDAEDARLAGFGWFGPPSDLDFVIASDDPDEVAPLLAEIVDWAEERRTTISELAAAAPATVAPDAAAPDAAAPDAAAPATSSDPLEPLRIWASDADPAAAVSLAALGFEREDKPGFVHFTGDLAIADTWPPLDLPAGLTLRRLTSEADLASRVECGRAAFTGSTQTAERYRTVRETWLYRPDLDFVVVTDEGRVVAFTLAWLDPATATVELEPVGVHPDWHRRGLGLQICRAALRAARDLGARRAMIASDRSNPAAMGLYERLGLEVTAAIVPHVRRVEAGAATPSPSHANPPSPDGA